MKDRYIKIGNSFIEVIIFRTSNLSDDECIKQAISLLRGE